LFVVQRKAVVMTAKGYLIVFYFLQLLTAQVQLRGCRKPLDVAFVVYAGSDITDQIWYMLNSMSRDVSRQLRPSASGTHVAQMWFSGEWTVVRDLEGAVLQWQYRTRARSLQSGRNLADALEAVISLVLNNTGGDRPEVPDVVVVVTHGLVDDREAAIAQANRLKAKGIRIVTVGMANTQVQ